MNNGRKKGPMRKSVEERAVEDEALGGRAHEEGPVSGRGLRKSS